MLFKISSGLIPIALLVTLYFFHIPANAQPALIFNTTGQPPLNNATNNGFMDEVTREALKRIGYRLIIKKLPAERALRSANNGSIDGEMSRIIGLETHYSNLIRVPEKIMDWKFCVFSKYQLPLSQGWNSLAGKNVAFITGWKILEINTPKSARVTKVRNSQNLFNLLARDRTDFAIYEYWGGRYLINKLKLDDIKLREPALASREMYIYLHSKHKAIVPLLSQALSEMKNDGTYQKLRKKHLNFAIQSDQ